MPALDNALDVLVDKLRRLGRLDAQDVAAVHGLPFTLETIRGSKYLVREGNRIENCCILLDGYACRNKLTQEGKRQIVSFHLPGDVLDLQHLLLDRADHNVQSITRATVAWVPVKALRDLARNRINIGAALWRDTLIDASIFREWVLNVGQRSGRARIAHMLCEFATRRAAAGIGEPVRFELPMTQDQIADATGMTPIHVNRMLAALRAEGIISHQKREVEILDWDKMRHIADFDPAYLHQAAA